MKSHFESFCAVRDGRRRLLVLLDFLDTNEFNCNSSKVCLLVLILSLWECGGGETAPPVLEIANYIAIKSVVKVTPT